MSDHLFTPAFLLFGIALGGCLGYLELVWLKRTLTIQGSWQPLLVIALVNVVFIYLLSAIRNSYFSLLLFPLPVIPVAYLVLKAVAYWAVARMSGGRLHSSGKLLFLTLLFHGAVYALGFEAFARINPTRDNLEKAIRAKQNAKFAAMLWMSVRREPAMSILVNEAIVSGNEGAVRSLIRRGADPRGDYWLRDANHEILWRMTQWMLDRGVPPDELGRGSQGLSFEEIALSYGPAELQLCFDRGFDPKKYPASIHAAISQHPLRQAHTIAPDEVEALKRKILMLIEHGANVNGKDVVGFSPLFELISLKLDLAPILSLLIEKGADVNAQTPRPMYPQNRGELPKGLTPLMLAIVNGHNDYVPILLQSGAGKELRDNNGSTALDYARELQAGKSTADLLR